MSTVVLARKYRPRTFAQMTGQDHVVRALGNALRQGRLHHAYLFTGTRGIGKTTVSRILAKSLNCTGPDGQGGITAEPCGVCSACTQIDADRFVDYIELDAASNRGIDDARDMIERAAYKPAVGRFKVFMIDEAHQLTKEAFNALLKTLEEPPEYLKFVLATTDPEKVLPTVLSRCLQFNLRPMAPETVRDHLVHVLQAEGVEHDEGGLRLISRAARGSMRDALSLTDQAIAYGGGRFDEAIVRAMLGTADAGVALALVRALAARDGPAVLAAVDGLREAGQSAASTLEQMAVLLQQMAVEQAVPGSLPPDDPDAAAARELAGLLPADETQLLYSIVLHGRGELSLMADDYAAATMVLLRFLAFPPAGAAPAAAPRAAPLRAPPPPATAVVPRAAPATAVVPKAAPATVVVPKAAVPNTQPVTAVVAKAVPSSTAAPIAASPGSASAAAVRTSPAADAAPAEPPRARPAGRPAPPPWDPEETLPDEAFLDDTSGPEPAPPVAAARPAPAVVEVPPPATPEDAARADRWNVVVRGLIESAAVSGLVRELAWQSALSGIDDQAEPPCWRLRVEHDALMADALRDKLADALSAALGERVALRVEVGAVGDTPARREAAERNRRQREAEESIRNDPVVQDLMSQFKSARIVPGSVKPI